MESQKVDEVNHWLSISVLLGMDNRNVECYANLHKHHEQKIRADLETPKMAVGT